MLVHIRVMQQNLRGNTADMQAGTAEKRIFLYYHGLEPKLASPNRGHIPTRSATDNRCVLLSHAPSPSTLVVSRATQHLQPDFGGLRFPIIGRFSVVFTLLRRINSSREPARRLFVTALPASVASPRTERRATTRQIRNFSSGCPAPQPDPGRPLPAHSQARPGVPRYWRRVPP